jgi:hypothetical protein
MAGRYDIRIDQGATFRLTLRFRSDTGTVDEAGNPVYVPYDFGGALIRCQFREHFGSPVTVIEAMNITDPPGILVGPAGTGTITVLITADQTANLFRYGRYDIWCQFPSGESRRLLEGTVSCNRRVTEG